MNGYKTYIVASLMALLTTANMMGYITAEQFQMIMGLLASFGLATMRMAVAEVPKEVVKEAPPVIIHTS